MLTFLYFVEGSAMTDDYLLSLISFAFHFDYFDMTIFFTFLQFSELVNLQVGFYARIKKPAKKSFRVLAGM
jgi:hypothetical protein